MKLFAKAVIVLWLVLPVAGCKPVTNTNTPIAPGYSSVADQQIGQTLVAAHAFYATIQGDVAAGTYKPSPTEKTTLNNFATALNSAQIVYISYHNGLATLQQAQAAVQSVQTQQAQIQTSIGGTH